MDWDEEKELDGESVQESEETKEEDDLSEDPEQEKQKINEFNAKGNQAFNQAFIQTLNIKANYILDVEKEKEQNKKEEKYDLQKKEDCIRFVENYKKGDYLAVAAILCVFEAVIVSELPWLMTKIAEYLPDVKGKEEDEKGIYNNCNNPYIALDTVLNTIGAKHLTTEEGQQCISLGISTTEPLKNMWEMFPALRQSIISWLLSFLEVQSYNSVFEFYQIVTAFVKVISLDIRTAERYIFPVLYSSPKNMWLLGNILFKLYEKDGNKEYWENLIIKSLKTSDEWLWRAPSLTYALFIENDIRCKYDLEVKKLFAKRVCLLRRSDINFILNYLFLSDKIRTWFCEILDIAFKNAMNKEEIAVKYLLIIRYGFYRIGRSKTELPLLICDEIKQHECLKAMIAYIMSKYFLRKQLYRTLEVYIKEISAYKYSKKLPQYLAAYFYNMSLAEREHVDENIFFLNKCECELAQNIEKILRMNNR